MGINNVQDISNIIFADTCYYSSKTELAKHPFTEMGYSGKNPPERYPAGGF
jgi:hypothetical protein